jgi:3D (Asp-Asp-Asp) domain-containing protein
MPFGTVVTVPGYGRVRCEDRGSGVKGRRLDVLLPTHAEARAWGVKNLKCGVEKRRANHGEK